MPHHYFVQTTQTIQSTLSENLTSSVHSAHFSGRSKPCLTPRRTTPMIRQCLVLALLAFSFAAPSRADDRPMEVFFIDAMGGAATLVVTPERESILIDSGWAGFDDRDPKRIVEV